MFHQPYVFIGYLTRDILMEKYLPMFSLLQEAVPYFHAYASYSKRTTGGNGKYRQGLHEARAFIRKLTDNGVNLAKATPQDVSVSEVPERFLHFMRTRFNPYYLDGLASPLKDESVRASAHEPSALERGLVPSPVSAK